VGAEHYTAHRPELHRKFRALMRAADRPDVNKVVCFTRPHLQSLFSIEDGQIDAHTKEDRDTLIKMRNDAKIMLGMKITLSKKERLQNSNLPRNKAFGGINKAKNYMQHGSRGVFGKSVGHPPGPYVKPKPASLINKAKYNVVRTREEALQMVGEQRSRQPFPANASSHPVTSNYSQHNPYDAEYSQHNQYDAEYSQHNQFDANYSRYNKF